MNKWFKLGAVAATLFLGACSTSTSTTTSKDTVSQAQKNWDAIEKSGKIKVATAGTLYPQSFHTDKDNSLTGYDVEIVKEVAKRLNLEVDFTEMGVDGMLTALDSGQVDIANYSIEEGSKYIDKYLKVCYHIDMSKIYKPNEFGKMIGRTVNTLQRWDREGILKARRTPTNRRYYTEEDYYNIMGIQQENVENQVNDVIIYARVSNQNQKDDLKNQVEFLKTYANAKGYIVSNIITDIGSGLNYNRKGFNSILYSEKKQKILISYKDRFVRFGYSWFDNFLKSKGSEIIVVNNQTLSPQQELVEDLISIIQIFSCRIDGLKKYKKKIKNDEEL